MKCLTRGVTPLGAIILTNARDKVAQALGFSGNRKRKCSDSMSEPVLDVRVMVPINRSTYSSTISFLNLRGCLIPS